MSINPFEECWLPSIDGLRMIKHKLNTRHIVLLAIKSFIKNENATRRITCSIFLVRGALPI